MQRYPWGMLWPLLFSMACLLLSLSYSLNHPQATIPAYLSYLTLGCLGLVVCLAIAPLHRRIAALERHLIHEE